MCILLLIGCAGAPTGEALWARLTAANLLAGSVAQGLDSAVRAGAIAPGSARAELIVQILDATELSLNGAGMALRSRMPAIAERQLDAAEAQLEGLQPLVPIAKGDEE
jgi:hypothetical protein